MTPLCDHKLFINGGWTKVESLEMDKIAEVTPQCHLQTPVELYPDRLIRSRSHHRIDIALMLSLKNGEN